jgi:hypothetical protein
MIHPQGNRVLQHWKWRQQITLKHWYLSTKLYSITSQNTVIFILIPTTSDLTCKNYLGLNTSRQSTESTVHTSDYLNKQNCMFWSAKTPCIIHERECHRTKVNMWCAVGPTGVIGLYFFNNMVTIKDPQICHRHKHLTPSLCPSDRQLIFNLMRLHHTYCLCLSEHHTVLSTNVCPNGSMDRKTEKHFSNISTCYSNSILNDIKPNKNREVHSLR